MLGPTFAKFSLNYFPVLRTELFGLSAIVFMFPGKKKESPKRGAHRTHTAHQQLKNVEQASASSGNQCFLGHRFVPRIGLFAFDHSTIRRQSDASGAGPAGQRHFSQF